MRWCPEPGRPPRATVAALVAAAVALAAPSRGTAHLDQPPAGHTGGFGEPTCASCHRGAPLDAAGGSLSLDAPATFAAGEEYRIAVRLERAGMRRAGFQLSARFAEGEGAGRQAGELTAVSAGAQLVAAHDVTYAAQTADGARVGEGEARWTVGWRAPAAADAPVLFHLAANAANDDDSELGDHVYLASAVSRPAAARPLLVTGGTVVTFDAAGTVLADGAVAVVGERIAAVGAAGDLARRYPAAERIDARGAVVLPGLINAHTHAPMVLFRGLADDLPLMEWLEEHIFPAEAAHVDEEFVRAGTRLACLEMLRGGTTTFVDMYYFEDAIAEEVERCGMRAVLGETLIDFPAPDHPTWEAAVAYTRRFVERWRGHPRITPAVAPHAPYTVSPEHLVAAHALAAELDVPLLVHLAEDRAEIEQVRQRTGRTSIELLAGLGVLSDRLLAAHVVWPTAEEIELLAAHGVGVAHCPQSNMKIAAGVAPVPDLLAAGVAVGIGTDGAGSNNDLDLWEEVDTAAKLHKVTRGDPTVLPARQAFELATIGGARALDMQGEIGSLEPGKRADLVVVRATGLHQWPQDPAVNPYSFLVYATKAADVDTVLVDGRVVVRGGRVLTLDEQEVRAHAAALRARLEGGPTPP
ncbi:MAG TPA: amidohydrolase [Thermoanaerobaculia bacterium]|nr:amidohydrolase [Thermoanaerobaculia bacterium]